MFTCAKRHFKSAQIDYQHGKLNLMCETLGTATADKMVDVGECLPMKDRYNIFKAALIDRFAVSNTQQMWVLLQGVMVANRKPLEPLLHMKKLAGKNASNTPIHTYGDRRIMQELGFGKTFTLASVVLLNYMDPMLLSP